MLKRANGPSLKAFAEQKTSNVIQYNEHQLAQLAATVAAGLLRGSDLLEHVTDKERTRAAARDAAKVSLLVARHILVGAHSAAQKIDELELLYDDADFL